MLSLLFGANPLPESMVTYHLWGPMAKAWEELHNKYSIHQPLEYEAVSKMGLWIEFYRHLVQKRGK